MAELTRRYIVMAMATQGPFDMKDVEAAFVLKPWKDPAALRALEAYRDYCYPELATELDDWIKTIASGPALRGNIGERNERHMSEVAKDAAIKARPRPKAKAKRVIQKRAKKRVKRHR